MILVAGPLATAMAGHRVYAYVEYSGIGHGGIHLGHVAMTVTAISQTMPPPRAPYHSCAFQHLSGQTSPRLAHLRYPAVIGRSP